MFVTKYEYLPANNKRLVFKKNAEKRNVIVSLPLLPFPVYV